MIGNAEYFAADQDLADAFAAGELTRAEFIAARAALADTWNVPATLAKQVVDFTAEQRTVLDEISLFNLTGEVATVGALPGGAAAGETWLVDSNGHAYLRLTSSWKDLGPWGGRGGVAIFSVTGAPAASLGVGGDLALDLATGDFYGPKDGSGWGAPVVATGLQAKVVAAEDARDAAETARVAAEVARDQLGVSELQATWKRVLVADSSRRIAVAVDAAGKTFIWLRDDAMAGADTLKSQLAPAGAGALMEVVDGLLSFAKGAAIGGTSFTALTNENYAFAICDAQRRVSDLAIGRDGRFAEHSIRNITGRLDATDLDPRFREAVKPDAYVATVLGNTPNRSLYIDSKPTGRRVLITATGDPHDPLIMPDGHVVWTAGTGRMYFAPCEGGAVYPVLPDAALTGFGDSLTASVGTDWVALLGSILGITATNAGVPGQASSDIALRQGGLTPSVSITGGSIPASGAVGLTISPVAAWRSGSGSGTFSFAGSILGIAGTLSHNYGTDTWTFTRSISGSVTAVPNGTPFVFSGVTHDTEVQLLWAGYNNRFSTGSLATAPRDIASMVANIKTYVKRFLVFSITNSAFEPEGSGGYDEVIGVNAQLEALYGDRYFDFRRWAIDHGLASVGLSATSQDLIDIAADIIPSSLRIDETHYTPAFYAAIATKVAAVLISKGWF